MKNTSWENVGKWYNDIVGTNGHYYHEKIILPNVLRLLNLNRTSKLLDLGCGQGILARVIPPEVEYLGLDLSVTLIEEARKLDKNPKHSYGIADVSKELPIRNSGFSHACLILALQNIKHQFNVVKNAAKHLNKGGRMAIVLNHPSFRIPKHSGWEVDKDKMTQYRKTDSYMSHLEVPIDSSPFDKENNKSTWSFHYPLSAYSEMLYDNGFLIEKIEEWVSDKKSEGGMAKIEDRARKEFPLFMTIIAYRK
jgi:ubiquinone/menaquinone biosynthesis C-methylase UbiE